MVISLILLIENFDIQTNISNLTLFIEEDAIFDDKML